MGWAESVSRNGMGRNGMGPIDVWAQMGRAQTGWAESAGYQVSLTQPAVSELLNGWNQM